MSWSEGKSSVDAVSEYKANTSATKQMNALRVVFTRNL
eukprot:CAMPEP_0195087896 /NCGR_PEP_ID=MMETSP0448-20130528/27614_1 /TAXON_ID=66468 /ORGANISM="Heterocapsa triquestra, Strain CCMP 448" /LENGTH=37 /DNA_ID= /DNA_START= /DNA_END= /DNA_ORIENTATION=